MNTADIRQALHKYIDQLDEATLQALYTMLEKYAHDKLSLSEAEKKAVEEGLASISQGNTFNHEDVINEMKEKYPNLHRKQ